MIRGYHIYKEIWEASHGEKFDCVRETGNRFDPFAVAFISEDGEIIGHVPKLISAAASSLLQYEMCRISVHLCCCYLFVQTDHEMRRISVQNKIFVDAKTPRNPRKFEPHENYYPYGTLSHVIDPIPSFTHLAYSLTILVLN